MLIVPRFRTGRRALATPEARRGSAPRRRMGLWLVLATGLLPLPSSAGSTVAEAAPIVDATGAPALPIETPADVAMLDASALSDLVAPIALYPDDLLARTLMCRHLSPRRGRGGALRQGEQGPQG